jgi:hypothetical protein
MSFFHGKRGLSRMRARRCKRGVSYCFEDAQLAIIIIIPEETPYWNVNESRGMIPLLYI